MVIFIISCFPYRHFELHEQLFTEIVVTLFVSSCICILSLVGSFLVHDNSKCRHTDVVKL